MKAIKLKGDFLIHTIAVIISVIVLLIILNFLPFIIGLSDGYSDTIERKRDCQDMSRIEYVFFGHQFGCYLSEEI